MIDTTGMNFTDVEYAGIDMIVYYEDDTDDYGNWHPLVYSCVAMGTDLRLDNLLSEEQWEDIADLVKKKVDEEAQLSYDEDAFIRYQDDTMYFGEDYR